MIEVCVDSLVGAALACEAGADRIELSENLSVGGVTPRAELTLAVRRHTDLALIVLVRCRDGGFVFDESEKARMLEEVREAVQLGADGVAVGGLLPSGELDVDFLRRVVEVASDKQLVMHRAFDEVLSHSEALEQLVEIGFHRVLTSGGPLQAWDGVEALARLNRQAAGRIEILPAGGIGPNNAQAILERTGCHQLHGSFRSTSSAGPMAGLPDREAIASARKALFDFIKKS